MQAILCLQQEKAAAGLDAANWKASSEAAQSKFDSAEAGRIEVEGLLLAKRNEVYSLQQSSAQQSQVRSQIYGLKSSCCLVYACRIIESNTAMSVCVCWLPFVTAGAIKVLRPPHTTTLPRPLALVFLWPHPEPAPHTPPA